MSWRDRVTDPLLGTTSYDLSETVREVFMEIVNGNLVDFTNLGTTINAIHLITALRATNSMKDKTIGWNTALSIADNACRTSNLNTDVIDVVMAGLLPH